LPQPESWAALSVQAQLSDPDSTLCFYRNALRLRHERPELGDSSLEWIDATPGLLAIERGESFACVVNFTDGPLELPPGLISAIPLIVSEEPGGTMPAGFVAGNSAVWLSR